MEAFPDPSALASLSKRQIARLISRLEQAHQDADLAFFLDGLLLRGAGHVLGLTGPPGVGKSSLTNALVQISRAAGKRVAVLAIDPSSKRTGGALLGDRTRLKTDPEDAGIFVRSMAAGARLGGLSDHALAAIAVLRAGFDLVIVESVGTGQSESDLATACDTLCLCMQPGAGDSLQFMKAGIIELPHIIAVTKADLGAAARRTAADIQGALSLGTPAGARTGARLQMATQSPEGPRSGRAQTGWPVPVLEVSATGGSGLDRLVEALEAHQSFLSRQGERAAIRQQQHQAWLEDMVRQRFGSFGVEWLARPGGGRTLAAFAGRELARDAVFARFLACSQVLMAPWSET